MTTAPDALSDAEVERLARVILDEWEAARATPNLRLISLSPGTLAKRQLAHEFGRRHGWTWQHHDFSAEELTGRRQRYFYRRTMPPRHDHGCGYLQRRARAATVIQPYNVTDEHRAEMQRWADEHGLVLMFPDFPSWWLPTHTTLCVFARPDRLLAGITGPDVPQQAAAVGG
ncbi:hypothetical protein [Roseomonas sp. BN140053]|uniref:hypothetical protein n=1 Tax=Roseomonas sp. BN140053 TaxID=3391898 RepID=UPI0039ECAFB1